MFRQQPLSSSCVVRVAPQNCPQFQALCDSLSRNDPTITTLATDRSSTPEGYGHRLGEALLSNNNSIVSELVLHLNFLLSETDRGIGTMSSATSLLTWMERSSSLQTVTLHSQYGTFYDRYERLELLLLQRLVCSMKRNPNIQVFHSYLYLFYVPLLSEYLSPPTSVSKLHSLKIDIRSYVASELEQAAQAIAALSGLKQLSLACFIEFLRLLPTHSTLLLRELNVDLRPRETSEASDVTLFSSILSSSKALQRLDIEELNICSKTWKLIQTGLQANPSITHLKLENCDIVPDARSLIVNHMQSSNKSSHQYVRNLYLSGREVWWLSTVQSDVDSPTRLGQMICGSLLQHVTFALPTVLEQQATEFFAVLAANSSAVRLRSMHLIGGSLLWDSIEAYLSSTVHLFHLTSTVIRGGNDDEFAVPLSCLHSLRCNGSLHTVVFKDRHGQLYTPNDNVSRFIQACMTRNRELSDLMKSSFHSAAGAEANERIGPDRDDENATDSTRFPTLCRVSQQAERMAPNTILQGLLASSRKRASRKRAAAETFDGDWTMIDCVTSNSVYYV